MNEWKSEAIDKLSASLVAAQANLHNAAKSATNTYLNTKYADLATVREAIVGTFAEQGLAVLQTFAPHRSPRFEVIKKAKDRENLVSIQVLGILRTVLVHTSGQWISSELPIATTWGDSQTVGGAITYFRRYALAAMAGLAQEDDDGEAAKGQYHRPEPTDRRDSRPAPPRQVAPSTRPPAKEPPPPPKDGHELFAKIREVGANLVDWTVETFSARGYPVLLEEWTAKQIEMALPEIRAKTIEMQRAKVKAAANGK